MDGSIAAINHLARQREVLSCDQPARSIHSGSDDDKPGANRDSHSRRGRVLLTLPRSGDVRKCVGIASTGSAADL